jgi:transposase
MTMVEQAAESDSVRELVPDELWELFRTIVPAKLVQRPQGGGRRRADDRQVLAAIVYVATTGQPWRQIPEDFGVRWPTAYRRFTEWRQAHIWTRLLTLIVDHGESLDLVWPRQAIEAVLARAAESKLSISGTVEEASDQLRAEPRKICLSDHSTSKVSRRGKPRSSSRDGLIRELQGHCGEG